MVGPIGSACSTSRRRLFAAWITRRQVACKPGRNWPPAPSTLLLMAPREPHRLLFPRIRVTAESAVGVYIEPRARKKILSACGPLVVAAVRRAIDALITTDTLVMP